MAGRDGIGNTPTMTASPPPTRYHRWLGWFPPAMRRAAIVSSIGLLIVVVLVWFLPWGMAVVAGWDAAALTFLLCIWPTILRADAAHVAQLATREDETRGTAAVLLVGASVASLLGVGLALRLAGRESGPLRVLLIGFAVLTVVVSWTVVNTIYTLRYADLLGVGLGVLVDQRPACDPDHAAGDEDLAVVQVDIAPLEAAELAAARPEDHGQAQEEAEFRILVPCHLK